jgi:hypothetical protein
MENELDEFFEEEKAEAVEAPQPEPEQAEAEAPEQPEPEATGEPEPAPPAEPKEDRHAPLTALLDEREKRQAAQRELQDLRRKMQEIEAAKAPKPDFFENPEQALAQERAQFQFMLWNERLNMSEAITRQAHGDEAVEEATAAYQAAMRDNPTLEAELKRERNPYGYVVKWHQRQKMLSEIGDDPSSYRAKLETEIRERLMDELQQNPPSPPKPSAPPRSLATAPSAGTAQPNLDPLDEIFGS